MVYVYVRDGLVKERVSVPPAGIFSLEYADQFIEAPDVVQWGWGYDGRNFVPAPTPPEPVPASCSWRQGQKALLRAGKLDAARAAIEAIEDPFERQDAEIEFGSPTYERASSFLQQMWTTLGGTSEQLDDLFRVAVTL